MSGRPKPGDSFSQEETVENIVPGSGPAGPAAHDGYYQFAGLCAGTLLALVFLGTLLTRPPQSHGFIYFQF